VTVDTQEWADQTVSVHEAGGRHEVWLWMGTRYRDTEGPVPGTWAVLATFDDRGEAEAYRSRAAQVLENALRLSLPAVRDGTLVARTFPLREGPVKGEAPWAPRPHDAASYLRLHVDVHHADARGWGDAPSRRAYLADAWGRMAESDREAARGLLRAWLAELGG
jgi:hypothetical protein